MKTTFECASENRVDVRSYKGSFPVLCEPSSTPGSGTVLLYLNKEQFICISQDKHCGWEDTVVHSGDDFLGSHVVCPTTTRVTLSN